MEKQQATQARRLTLCFCSSVRTSLRTFAHGMSSGHQMGLQLSLPQPGFPRPVEYLSISGINARSCAWKTRARSAAVLKGIWEVCGHHTESLPGGSREFQRVTEEPTVLHVLHRSTVMENYTCMKGTLSCIA